jgi:hypothetical protein
MAVYKNGNYLQQSSSGIFDTIHQASAQAPYSGIYAAKEAGTRSSRPRAIICRRKITLSIASCRGPSAGG